MDACIEVHRDHKDHAAIKEAHEVLIQESCALMKTCNHCPDSEESHHSKHSIYFDFGDFFSILHLVHDDVIDPKSEERVEMIGRSSKIEFASVPYDFLTQPKRSAIFVKQL
jgi:uncharacterized DUF497 family protein